LTPLVPLVSSCVFGNGLYFVRDFAGKKGHLRRGKIYHHRERNKERMKKPVSTYFITKTIYTAIPFFGDV